MNQKPVTNLNIIKPLGKGGFAEVYLARDSSSNILYALKKINEKNMNSIVKKYLENEIKILKMVKHPNIVKLYNIFNDRQFPNIKYLALEYCNGGTLYKNLYEYINKYRTPFSEKLVQKLMKNILFGVKYLHDNGIIHRDLKLGNILVKYKNDFDLNNQNLYNAEIKIIDFNSSYILNNFGPMTALGTIPNMAPSVVLNMIGEKNVYDEKIDIWSLGTLCYEMLFGKPLFSYLTKEQIFKNILSCNFKIPKTISVQARTFLYCMLKKEGINRLSATQLLNHEFIIGDYHKFIKYNNKINKVVPKEQNKIINIIVPREQKQLVYNGSSNNIFYKNKLKLNISPKKDEHNSNEICIGCGKYINDILYKCTVCYGVIICENCYLKSFKTHPHIFKVKIKRKIERNITFLNMQQIPKIPNFNIKKNICFEEVNGRKNLIIVNDNITVNELLNLYCQRIKRFDLINNYHNKINFFYNTQLLNNIKDKRIDTIFSYDFAKVQVIIK